MTSSTTTIQLQPPPVAAAADDGDDGLRASILTFRLALERKRAVYTEWATASDDSITPRCVDILMDWLLVVTSTQQLHIATRLLMADIMHRALSAVPTHRTTLQAMGCAATWIACKMEEVCAMEVADWVYLCDNAYTEHAFINWEHHICVGLEYRFSRPTLYHFLEHVLTEPAVMAILTPAQKQCGAYALAMRITCKPCFRTARYTTQALVIAWLSVFLHDHSTKRKAAATAEAAEAAEAAAAPTVVKTTPHQHALLQDALQSLAKAWQLSPTRLRAFQAAVVSECRARRKFEFGHHGSRSIRVFSFSPALHLLPHLTAAPPPAAPPPAAPPPTTKPARPLRRARNLPKIKGIAARCHAMVTRSKTRSKSVHAARLPAKHA